jgi:hypothetical protein
MNYTEVHRPKHSNHDAFDGVDLAKEGRRCVRGAFSLMEDRAMRQFVVWATGSGRPHRTTER